MEHQHTAHLPYDHQGQESPMAGMSHGDGRHNDHMINYDKQQANSMQMMMMEMFFHFGLGDTVLFRGLVIDSAWKLWLTSVSLFLAAILLEMIDYSRGYLSCRCSRAAADGRHASASSQTQLINNSGTRPGPRQEPDGNHQRWSCCSGSNSQPPTGFIDDRESPTIKQDPVCFPVRTTDSPIVRLMQSCLHFLRTGLSLCLMLAAMTCNVCLIFPILLGSGVGFYIFYRPALDTKSVMCH